MNPEESIRINARNPACGLIKNELKHRGITQDQAACDLEVSTALLSSVVNHKRDVSTELALKLEAYLGISAEVLMKSQASYKLKKHRLTIGTTNITPHPSHQAA